MSSCAILRSSVSSAPTPCQRRHPAALKSWATCRNWPITAVDPKHRKCTRVSSLRTISLLLLLLFFLEYCLGPGKVCTKLKRRNSPGSRPLPLPAQHPISDSAPGSFGGGGCAALLVQRSTKFQASVSEGDLCADITTTSLQSVCLGTYTRARPLNLLPYLYACGVLVVRVRSFFGALSCAVIAAGRCRAQLRGL